MDDNESLWKEIDTDIDLYKFYFELLIKSATFNYAITGAMISWYFSHIENVSMKQSLWLSLIINGGFLIICLFSIIPARKMKRDFEETCNKLKFKEPYDMNPFLYTLCLFVITYALITLGLIKILFC